MILVTGGTGFLGAHLLYHLLQCNKEVTSIHRKNSSFETIKRIFLNYSEKGMADFDKIKWIESDILKAGEIEDSFKNIEIVYHTAAMVSYNPSDNYKMYVNNVEGTRNVVNAAISNNIKKLCYVSSIAALGESGSDSLIDEATAWKEEYGNSGYSVSKFYAELEVWRGIEEGLNAVIVNPSVILGYGNWDKGSNALFNAVYKGLNYYTLGSSGFISVEDVCNLMIMLTDSEECNSSFILNAENIEYKSVFEMIAASLKVKSPKKHATPVITEILWRLESLRSRLSFKSPVITKESARTSHKLLKYTDGKLQKSIKYQYKSVEETINELGNLYLREHS